MGSHLQNGRCALSGLEIVLIRSHHKQKGIKNSASLDRIDSKYGYISGNCQWVHKDINIMKRSFNQIHFIQMCNAVSGHCNITMPPSTVTE
jgi:hypothetical protein